MCVIDVAADISQVTLNKLQMYVSSLELIWLQIYTGYKTEMVASNLSGLPILPHRNGFTDMTLILEILLLMQTTCLL